MVSHRIGRRGRAALVLAVLGLGGCATSGDLRELQFEIRSLAARQDSAFRALQRLVESSGDEALDSVADLTELVFQLRGDVNRRLLDIQDQQLRMGELVGQSQRSIALMTEQLNAQRREIERVSRRQPADTTEAVAEEDAEEPPETARPDPAEDAYNEIVALQERGSMSVARNGFEQFLEEYPSSEFAAGAHLRLAEIKALQDDEIEDAIDTYMLIPDLFPEAPEVPQALFQAGLLCASIEDFERARGYLEWLVESYPEHRLVPLARERLEAIP